MIVVLALATPLAFANAGDLDPSFGHAGKATRAANFGSQQRDSVSTDSARLPGGGTVVLARQTLYSFGADGSIARGFGAVKIADPTGSELQPSDIAVDSRGRVLVAGGSKAASGTGESPEHVFVARYTPRGKLDPSFGDSGVVVTDFGLPGPRALEGQSAPASRVRVDGIAVDPSDRVVLTGTRLKAIGPCRGSIGLSYHEAFVARLASNGRPDPSFGDAGVLSLRDFPEATSGVQSLISPVVDTDGKVYLSTLLGPCEEGRDTLAGRIDSSGRADQSFGDGGWVKVSGGISFEAFSGRSFEPFSIALDPRGRLLLLAQHYVPPAESAGHQVAKGHRIAVVKRVLPNGALDQTFGRHGMATMSGPAGKFSLAGEAVDGSGRVSIAGTLGRSFFVGRFTPNGQIDRRFGRSGRVTTSFGAHSSVRAGSITIDARGRAVVAGTMASPHLPQGEGLALARYLGGR
jgi:uncharacterized delta-60 repeat protein